MRGDNANRTKVFILSALVIIAIVGVLYLMIPDELPEQQQIEIPQTSNAQGIVRLEVLPPTNQASDNGGGE